MNKYDEFFKSLIDDTKDVQAFYRREKRNYYRKEYFNDTLHKQHSFVEDIFNSYVGEYK